MLTAHLAVITSIDFYHEQKVDVNSPFAKEITEYLNTALITKDYFTKHNEENKKNSSGKNSDISGIEYIVKERVALIVKKMPKFIDDILACVPISIILENSPSSN